MDILKGIRPIDYVLTGIMVSLAALIGVANVTAGSDANFAHPLESQSSLMIPVFMVAALPILWRRRNILGTIAVSFIVIAASIPVFGWVTRCGFALPLSFAMAYALARFAGSKQNQLVGLGGIFAMQVATLVKDSSTGGTEALTLSVPLAALAWGIGYFVQSRSDRQAVETKVAVEHVHV